MKVTRTFFTFISISWGLVLLLTSLGCASSVNVNPIHVNLLAGEKISSFEVTNTSDKPLVMQAQMMKWTQRNGKDILEETKDGLVTPPLIKIRPQETQIVRVGLLATPDPKKGGTYRIILTEVIQPHVAPSEGIYTLLKLSLPLLVDPLTPATSQATVNVRALPNKTLKVKALNTGTSHFRVKKVSILEVRNREYLTEQPLFDYLIPFQEKEWDVALPKNFKGKEIQVLIETDYGAIAQTLLLSS